MGAYPKWMDLMRGTTTKECIECHAVKHLDQFVIQPRSKHGYRNQCKKCQLKETAMRKAKKRKSNPSYRPKTTHGMTRTKTYKVWLGMKSRCLNSEHAAYEDYGGRGISICDRWIDSFENFYADMGESPKNHLIDRIDVDGNYEPGNCRWVTPKQSANNRRITKWLVIDGEKKSLSEWCDIYGIPTSTVRDRLSKGFSEKESFLPPKQISLNQQAK